MHFLCDVLSLVVLGGLPQEHHRRDWTQFAWKTAEKKFSASDREVETGVKTRIDDGVTSTPLEVGDKHGPSFPLVVVAAQLPNTHMARILCLCHLF